MNSANKDLNILDLPEEILESVFQFFSFNETSEARAVCRSFNKHCQERLNKGFNRVDKLHGQIQKEVKNKLPRRESERRNHPLARHVDILSAIETRLSLLGMSYMKYIDLGLCCFIPGKVLDELFTILRTLQCDKQPPRSHEFLQELRDISSMAMEHFDEKIIPGLKQQLPAVTLDYPFAAETGCSQSGRMTITSISSLLSCQSTSARGPSVRSEITSLRNQLRTQTGSVQEVRKDLTETKVWNEHQRRKLLDQEKKIVQQGHAISELEKKVNEMNQKFSDVSAELAKLKGVREGAAGDTKACLIQEEFPHRGDKPGAAEDTKASLIKEECPHRGDNPSTSLFSSTVKSKEERDNSSERVTRNKGAAEDTKSCLRCGEFPCRGDKPGAAEDTKACLRCGEFPHRGDNSSLSSSSVKEERGTSRERVTRNKGLKRKTGAGTGATGKRSKR